MLSESLTQIQEITSEAGKVAWECHRVILILRQKLTQDLFELGEQLYKMAHPPKEFPNQPPQYQIMGFSSMEEYLTSPEINFKRTWAYDLMKVYKKFILEYGLDKEKLIPIGVSRLAILARNNVTNEDNLENWLYTARELSKADLIREVRGDSDNYQPSEDNLRTGFYRITRMTAEPFGEFTELGRRNVIVGRDEGGIVLRVK